MAGTDHTHFNEPAGMAFMPDGSFYIADGYVNSRVIKFDKNGKFLLEWGTKGSGPGQFNLVHSVTIDANKRIYAADRNNNRVQVFHHDGSYVKQFVYEPATHGSGSTWDLALWPDKNEDYMVMVDGTNNEMRTIRTSDGAVMSTVGRSGRNAGQFHWVHNIAIDSRGTVYTTEVDNGKRIQKWTPTNGTPQR